MLAVGKSEVGHSHELYRDFSQLCSITLIILCLLYTFLLRRVLFFLMSIYNSILLLLEGCKILSYLSKDINDSFLFSVLCFLRLSISVCVLVFIFYVKVPRVSDYLLIF